VNYYIQIDSNNYIIATISTSQTLGSPWISIPDTSLSTAQMAGATYTNGTVNAPAANYNLNVIKYQQVSLVTAQLAQALPAPVSYTTVAGVSSSWANSDSNQSYIARSLSIWDSSDWPSTWFLRDVNGNKVAMTYADAAALGKLMGNAVLNLETAYEKALSDIAAATTVSGVQAITLSNP
jgi:hypothetical protein